MAEQETTLQQQAASGKEEEDDDDNCDNPNYKPPAVKSLQELQELDKDDESLRKYKESLLGNVKVPGVDPNVPNIQMISMSLVFEGGPAPLVLDLTDLEGLKKKTFVMKEGVDYRVNICFKVNKEIVSGLKYLQTIQRKGIKMGKMDYMVGSYGPKEDPYDFKSTVCEQAPCGLMARGSYTIKSKFTDDDKNEHASWEWTLHIKKDWKD